MYVGAVSIVSRGNAGIVSVIGLIGCRFKGVWCRMLCINHLGRVYMWGVYVYVV